MGLFRELFYNSQGDDTIQFEHLTDYREKAIVAAHLGLCMDCYSAEEPDYNDFDYKGNPTLKPRKGKPFVDIAVDHMLSLPTTADKFYRKVLEKMKKKLFESGYFDKKSLFINKNKML